MINVNQLKQVLFFCFFLRRIWRSGRELLAWPSPPPGMLCWQNCWIWKGGGNIVSKELIKQRQFLHQIIFPAISEALTKWYVHKIKNMLAHYLIHFKTHIYECVSWYAYICVCVCKHSFSIYIYLYIIYKYTYILLEK